MKQERITKDALYLGMARLLGNRSTCPRRKVGCVLVDRDGYVLATGYNGVASKMPHCNEGFLCEGASSPSGTNLDGCEAIHAEQNAIMRVPNIRHIHTAYVTASPCMTCTKLLLGTGCQRIAFEEEYPHPAAKMLWIKSGREWG